MHQHLASSTPLVVGGGLLGQHGVSAAGCRVVSKVAALQGGCRVFICAVACQTVGEGGGVQIAARAHAAPAGAPSWPATKGKA